MWKFLAIAAVAMLAATTTNPVFAAENSGDDKPPYYGEDHRKRVGRAFYVYGYQIVEASPTNFDEPADGFDYRPVRRGRLQDYRN